MHIVGSNEPAFYIAAAEIKKHLPHVEVAPSCHIIYAPGRYYGIITPDAGNVIYDHVVLDPWFVVPENVFMVLTTVFTFGDIINAFVENNNGRAMRLLSGLGFINTGTLRQVGGTLEIYSMRRDEWLNNRIRLHFCKTQSQKQTQNT